MDLKDRIKLACKLHGFVTFCAGYSGRSMYGRECVGISGSKRDCMTVIADVIKAGMNDLAHQGTGPTDKLLSQYSEEVDTLMNFQMDSMGRDLILYWEELDENIDPIDGSFVP